MERAVSVVLFCVAMDPIYVVLNAIPGVLRTTTCGTQMGSGSRKHKEQLSCPCHSFFCGPVFFPRNFGAFNVFAAMAFWVSFTTFSATTLPAVLSCLRSLCLSSMKPAMKGLQAKRQALCSLQTRRPEELKPLAVHALLHVHAEEGHKLLARRREVEALRHVRGVPYRPSCARGGPSSSGRAALGESRSPRGAVLTFSASDSQFRLERHVLCSQLSLAALSSGRATATQGGHGQRHCGRVMALKSKYKIQLTGFLGLQSLSSSGLLAAKGGDAA